MSLINENCQLLVIYLCIMLVFNFFKKDEKYVQAFFLLMGSWLAIGCFSETIVVFPIFAIGLNIMINMSLISHSLIREKNSKYH